MTEITKKTWKGFFKEAMKLTSAHEKNEIMSMKEKFKKVKTIEDDNAKCILNHKIIHFAPGSRIKKLLDRVTINCTTRVKKIVSSQCAREKCERSC